LSVSDSHDCLARDPKEQQRHGIGRRKRRRQHETRRTSPNSKRAAAAVAAVVNTTQPTSSSPMGKIVAGICGRVATTATATAATTSRKTESGSSESGAHRLNHGLLYDDSLRPGYSAPGPV
jgi:hypothetical protein